MSFAVFVSTLHVQEKKKENFSKLFYVFSSQEKFQHELFLLSSLSIIKSDLFINYVGHVNEKFLDSKYVHRPNMFHPVY
jgi:hypothetical protein